MPTRFVRLTLLVALAGGVAPLLAGQTPPPQTGAGAPMQQPYQKPPTGFILGQVVDASTGQSIAGAIVTMNGAPPGPPLTTLPNGALVSPTDPASLEAQAAARNTRLMTNSSGQFVFHDLRGGLYGVTATAPGYVSGAYGQHAINGPSRAIDLPEDGHVGDATIKLWRYASVSGHVVDEAGEPVVGAYVRVLRAATIGARRTLVPGLLATTDDRGLYRFDALTPADYVVTIPQTTTTVPASNVEAYMNAITSGGSASSDFMREISASNAPFPSPGGIRIGDQQVQAQTMGQRALPIAPSA
jgi:hypothetical protein